MKDNDDAAQEKLAAIKKYIPVGDTPEAALMKMAKLGAVIDHWMKASELTVSAVQCWTSIEEFLGIVPAPS
jgi:L-fucose isomerase-like protein